MEYSRRAQNGCSTQLGMTQKRPSGVAAPSLAGTILRQPYRYLALAKMPKFIALLRGVNVGKNNRVPMAEFKAILERLGYTGVSTFLNSGNAVFNSSGRSAPKHATAIACALEQALGVSTPVIVKSAAELFAVVSASPINPPDTDHSKLIVAFAAEADALSALEPLGDLVRAPERFTVTAVAAFLYCPDGILQSKVAEALLGRVGKRVTTRNWATVMKLATLSGAGVA